MKKIVMLVAAVGLIVWVVSWFRAPEAVATSAARPWPGGMGTLERSLNRLPETASNEASVKFIAFAKRVPADAAADEFVRREMTSGRLAIGAPPALHDVAAMRELLLHQPIAWNVSEGIGGDDDTSTRRALQLTAARALVANALAKARAGDSAAWDDLQAVWNLARSLDGHPQVMAQTAALAMARMINAVAWKLPLPAPAWFREVLERDPMRPLLEAFQHQTASYWQDGAQVFPTKWFAASVEHDRLIAEEVFNETRCDVKVRANEVGVDVSSVWRRAFRYRAEREATANALRIREGKPIVTASQCSDGAWSFDGTTLRFPREIPTAAPDTPMPLVLRFESK